MLGINELKGKDDWESGIGPESSKVELGAKVWEENNLITIIRCNYITRHK